MALPVLQIMFGIGVSLLGFFLMRKRMILPTEPHQERNSSNKYVAGDKCVICLGVMLSGRDKYLLKCGHALHYNCYIECIQHDKRCPLCREPM